MLFHQNKCSSKNRLLLDESSSFLSDGFPSVSLSNFLNILNYWCPAVSTIFCSAIYPLNVPPCSPSASLSFQVEGRGLFDLPLIHRQSHRQPISFLLSLFRFFFFYSPCLSGSLCLSHLHLLAPLDLPSLAAAATVSPKTVLAPDRRACGSHQCNRDSHQPAVMWP